MRKLLLGAATIVTSVGITAGVAAAQTAISDIGPDSDATVTSEQTASHDYTSTNDLNVENNHDANAISGDAESTDSNTGGAAGTGDASNTGNFTANLSVTSSAGAGGSGSDDSGTVGSLGDVTVEGVGPNSSATVDTTLTNTHTVDLNNMINVENNVTQDATSGNATVNNNNEGGSATTGNASNAYTSSVTLSVTQ